MCGRPLEQKFQDIQDSLRIGRGVLISSEWARTKAGRVDFWIPDRKWAIKFLGNDQLQQYLSWFKHSGNCYGWSRLSWGSVGLQLCDSEQQVNSRVQGNIQGIINQSLTDARLQYWWQLICGVNSCRLFMHNLKSNRPWKNTARQRYDFVQCAYGRINIRLSSYASGSRGVD